MGNHTLKRILKRHKENPEDEELHRIIETAEIEKKDFDKVVDKASKQPPFDKQE